MCFLTVEQTDGQQSDLAKASFHPFVVQNPKKY